MLMFFADTGKIKPTVEFGLNPIVTFGYLITLIDFKVFDCFTYSHLNPHAMDVPADCIAELLNREEKKVVEDE